MYNVIDYCNVKNVENKKMYGRRNVDLFEEGFYRGGNFFKWKFGR